VLPAFNPEVQVPTAQHTVYFRQVSVIPA